MRQLDERIAEKVCTICGELKPIGEYYKDLRKPLGYQSECKLCRSKREKQYAKTPQGRKAHKKKKQAWVSRNPVKRRAHEKVKDAKSRGDLVPAPCEVCGETNVDAHHEDYNKPLEVRWLCRRHHAKIHTQ